MVKRLTRHGNSLALVIDKGILDLLEIGPETPLSHQHGRELPDHLPRSAPKRRREFGEALNKVNRRYGKALKRLAE